MCAVGIDRWVDDGEKKDLKSRDHVDGAGEHCMIRQGSYQGIEKDHRADTYQNEGSRRQKQGVKYSLQEYTVEIGHDNLAFKRWYRHELTSAARMQWNRGPRAIADVRYKSVAWKLAILALNLNGTSTGY